MSKKKQQRKVNYLNVSLIDGFPKCCGANIIAGLSHRTVTKDEFSTITSDFRSVTGYRQGVLIAITAHTVLTDDGDVAATREPGQVREEKYLEKQGFKKLKKWRSETGSDLILWFRPPTNK